MDIPSIFVFMNDCGADSDNKQVMGIKTISLLILSELFRDKRRMITKKY